MFLRLLLSVLLAGLVSTPALAQSFQSSFSDVQFDRTKGPATFSAGVQVDAATGAASSSIPLGPGIGERGLKFRPVLSMRIAPQLAISTADEWLVFTYGFPPTPVAVDTLYQRGFGSASLSPGSLDLGTMVSTLNRNQTTYSLPGGRGGRVLGQVPSSMTPSVVQSMLPAFGFSASDTVGYLPCSTLTPLASRTPSVQMGSTGHLIVGLRAAGVPDPTTGLTDEVMDDIQDNPPSQYRWHFPRRMLVIQGDVVYEFHYVDHTYLTRYIAYLAISQKTQLYSGHYMLTKIRNRFGEYISFAYDADGIGYTATWSTNPEVSIRVQAVGSVSVPAGQTTLMNSQVAVTTATQIRVSYQGISQPVSSYLMEISDPLTGMSPGQATLGTPASAAATTGINGQRANDMVHFDAANQSVQPLSVVEEATGQQISFAWSVGPASTWLYSVSPTVLSSVSTPTRTVTFNWQAYPFRQNYNPESWAGMVPGGSPGRPTFCYGVSKISDTDGTQVRITSHTRVLPASNWITDPSGFAQPDQWVSTAFYDAVTYPDGSIVLHRFVEPPSSNGTTGPDGMQNIAFIKTLERETRYYTPGSDWASDLSATSPSSSTAYKWVVKDRFDVRTISAPDGSVVNQSVPYPTRVRTWDQESKVLTIEEMADWDSGAYGWKTQHATSSVSPSPTLTVDYLSLAQQGVGYTAYPATSGFEKETDKTFSTDVTKWFIARVASETPQVLQDNTGFMTPGVALPDVQPSAVKNYNPTINRVDSVALKGSDGQTVTTSLSYQGTSGLSAVELASAYLSSPGLALSGQMGVSAYGYDANGFMNAISQRPNSATTLTTGQSQDELGRPMTQTDMNGKVQTFSWDSAGRLNSITPPDGDQATSLSYDTDFRGITVTRGAQVRGYRYNGFGELILEKRQGPGGIWSHKIYGLDPMGRKIGETVWLPGNGAAQEGDWAKPNLTETVTTVTPQQTICKTWGIDSNGNATCLTWQTIPATQITNAAAYTGTSIDYDGRGRVIRTVDPNNVQVTTQYLGLTRQVTLGSQVTLYTSDAAGRLVQVTDATGHVSSYFFDGGGRINQVQQVGDGGLMQTRTWSYNRLGWLTSLTQPESGTTAYAGFTVAGKPTVTSYNGRGVSMTPDWMGRPLSVLSSNSGDSSVSQSYAYDTATGGRGKLASSTDGNVTTAFTYGAAGGRLDSLTTTLPIQGTPQSFTQSFAYDTYGNRTSGSTSNNTWTQTYLPETGMPSLLSYGSTGTVASTPWGSWDPTSWMLNQIAYGNGVTSTFGYDLDQTRLNLLVHSPASGGPLAQWTYSYDSLGNLVRENNLVTGSFDQYGYDNLNRLVSALVESPTYGDQLQQFTYDAFGNRTSSTIQGVVGWSGARGASTATVTTSALQSDPNRHVVGAAFNLSDTALSNQLPAQTSTGVLTGATYDAQGNLTQVYATPGDSSTQLSMAYDALGRVVALANSKINQVERYQYTAEGLRTVVEVYQGSVAPTNLVKIQYRIYNDARQLVSEYELVME
jgi:YD repeat-containing protein